MAFSEPFRPFFPLGIFYLLMGILLWLPQLWNPGEYPVLLHRVLVLNGFTASFIGGFLMTAVPRFSQTFSARPREVIAYFLVTILATLSAYLERESWTNIFSALQPAMLLIFIFSRISKRQQNPPYSFVFIFVGLGLWLVSSLMGLFLDSEGFKHLHYEGSIAAIVLGVGSRLIPGILGHVQIVNAQKEQYERPVPLLTTVPWYFFLLILSYVGSYFMEEILGSWVRAGIVLAIGEFYWRLYKFPQERTALTWNIWAAGWLICLSFLLKAFWSGGGIHANHGFFINGIVLLSLLISTRVIQSHGPKEKTLENWKGLYVVSGLVLLASSTRVSAYLMPQQYLTHLGYSSLILAIAVILWAQKYFRYIFSKSEN